MRLGSHVRGINENFSKQYLTRRIEGLNPCWALSNKSTTLSSSARAVRARLQPGLRIINVPRIWEQKLNQNNSIKLNLTSQAKIWHGEVKFRERDNKNSNKTHSHKEQITDP